MAEAKKNSTFDLSRGFYQIPLRPSDKGKTSFVTPYGKFQFTVMPFGLRNAPATFQRMMDRLFGEMASFAKVYIDDIAVFSQDWSTHIQHLKRVLDKLKEEGLTIHLEKAHIGYKTCSFLGHIVGDGQISPQEAKTAAVRNFKQPRTKTEFRSFLGLIGYYRAFIPDFSSLAAPLTDLTRKDAPDRLIWTDACNQAFTTLKEKLCCQPVLQAPNDDLPYVLQTDASARGIGAILTQTNKNDQEHPVAYFSRKMFPRELNYSATEQEGLAVIEACKHFLPYLLGRPFTIVTDHRALTFLSKKESLNGRLARWMEIMRQFEYHIVYRPGKANSNADALSRQAWSSRQPSNVLD